MSYEDMPLDDYEQEKTEMSPQAVKKIVLGADVYKRQLYRQGNQG